MAARVPEAEGIPRAAKVIGTMMLGTPSRLDSSTVGSGTRSRCLLLQHQFGHHLTRVIEEKALDMISTTSRRIGGISSVPSSRAMQERQTNRKRKSPCLPMGVFRSPLSRMLLSPRLHQGLRSPSSSQRGLAEIDLNVAICNGIDLNATPEGDIDLNATTEGDIDLNATLEEHLGQHADDDGAAPPTQQRANRKELPDDTRKAVFEFLLAKSRNGQLKRNETARASAELSVHIRTVKRIWREGKRCLD